MRTLVLLAFVAALAAMPASAAPVAPGRLVLAQADVPAGFRIDREKSGLRTNEQEARHEPTVRAQLREWRRVTGYERHFDRAGEEISSRVDLFASPVGARELLTFFHVEMTKSGIKGLVRERVPVGAEGWLYSGRTTGAFVVVVWRHDRAFAGVAVLGLTRQQTLALARAQQRRITASLR